MLKTTAKNKIKLKNGQSGVALLIAVLMVGILISIVIAMSLVFIPKIRLAGEVRKSTPAIYAAESALEWCLYVKNYGSTSAPVMSNSASYINAATGLPPTTSDCSASTITIIGTYQGVSRAYNLSGF